MKIRSLAPAAAVAALLCGSPLVAPLAAQEEGTSAERQELIAELQQIQQQLLPLRQQAMQDGQLQRHQQELQQLITAEMTNADPEAEEKLARLDEIQTELQEAQQSGDQQMVGSLIQEMQGLQQELQQAQNQVMALEAVQEAVAEFRDELFAKMQQIDDEAEALIERAEEIEAQLEAQPTG